MSIQGRMFAPTVAALITVISGCSTADPATKIAGNAETTATPRLPQNSKAERGFVWSAEGGFKEISIPPNAYQLNVTDMNNRGEVVGYFTIPGGQEDFRAFIWSAAGGLRKLGSLVGPDGISMAWAIDDQTVIKGLSEGPSTIYNTGMNIALPDAFVWTQAEGMKPLARDSADPFRLVSAGGKLRLPANMDCIELRGRSNNGRAIGVGGQWVSSSSQVNGDTSHCRPVAALMWRVDGTPVKISDCGTLQWCSTNLDAVNDNGVVVGADDVGGFRWNETSGFDRIPLTHAPLYVVNEKGDAAGMQGEGDSGVPFIWKSSGEVTVIKLPSGSYGYPAAINDAGQIAGTYH
jgi:hypothetical protein